jgi:hemolysin activation/secretion protein
MMRNRTALAGFLMALLACASLRAQNQSYDQFAPKPVPPAAANPVNLAPSINTVAGSPDDLLLPALRGLVFVSRSEEVDTHGARSADGIVIASGLQIPAPEQFRNLVSPYLGQRLTRGKLNQLITAIIVHYRQHDHPVVDVIVPQQDITAGTVQVLLLESRVGTVTVTGNRWFSSKEIRGDFRINPGDQIIATDIRSDLEWANQNPFHTSDVIYQPGQAVGTTDIVLPTQDRFPARFYVGYEDSGNSETGFDRYLIGVNWGDAWHAGWGHQLNYQYTTSGDFRSLEAHSGSYVIPLPWWHHTLTFFGNYVTTQGELPPFISVKGLSYQISARYSIPLRPIGDYKHTLGLGFDYKYNKNSLEFGDIPLTAVPIEVRQFALTYDSSLRDQLGITSLNVATYFSPGNWGGDNSDIVFDESHSLATSNYAYSDVTLTRLTRLPHSWSLFLRGSIQWSDANLAPSEQLGLGGYDTVRGYDEREINNDEGYIFNVELRTPVTGLGKKLGWTRFNDQLQLLVFWDYGSGNNHTLLIDEPAHRTLSGTGVGLRYTINSNISVRADFGFQLLRSEFDNDHGNRGDLGVVISY